MDGLGKIIDTMLVSDLFVYGALEDALRDSDRPLVRAKEHVTVVRNKNDMTVGYL